MNRCNGVGAAQREILLVLTPALVSVCRKRSLKPLKDPLRIPLKVGGSPEMVLRRLKVYVWCCSSSPIVHFS